MDRDDVKHRTVAGGQVPAFKPIIGADRTFICPMMQADSQTGESTGDVLDLFRAEQKAAMPPRTETGTLTNREKLEACADLAASELRWRPPMPNADMMPCAMR